MTTVIGSMGGRVRTALFTDELANPRRAYLAAAVYWRVSQAEADAPPQIDPEISALLEEMQTAPPDRRAVLEATLQEYARRTHAELRRQPPLHDHVDRGNWSATGDGRTLIECYHKRFVRALGHDYPLPPAGQTLVVLIDEDVDAGAAPRIAVHSLELPAVHASDGLLTREQEQAFSSSFHSQWSATLKALPAVSDISRE